MAKAFVLMRTDWEYNDEYYYPNSGGHATKAYKDKAKAEEACKVANRNAARGKDKNCRIGLGGSFGEDYSYEIRQVDHEILEKMGLVDIEEPWEYTVPAHVSDDVLDKFLLQSKTVFYTVSEVDFDG